MKTSLTIIILLLLIQFPLLAQQTDVEKILEQINTINYYAAVYTSKTQVATFQPGEETVLSEYKTFVKGVEKVLVIYTKPQKDVGKKILLLQDKIWFYFPKAGQAIIMNPTTTLFGTVSLGDVVSPPILDLYEFIDAESVTFQGNKVLKFEFKARSIKSTYGRIIYYYDDNKIIASEAYTRSDILLKRAYFMEFVTNSQGITYATKIKVESAINPEYYSLMLIKELKEVSNIPDYYFNPHSLDKVNE